MSTLQEESTIKEEYELWRKNCRYMYDFVSETALTWPSLTVQWLPHSHIHDSSVNAKLLLGTHTSGEGKNYLKLASTQLPYFPAANMEPKKKVSSIIKISKKFETSSEVNRARYMPQDSNIVATINGDGECDIFKLEEKEDLCRLKPHTDNGYGLSWNSFERGLLLTASDDKTVVVSDINKNNDTSKQIYKDHTGVVNDAKWHNFQSFVFGSVSDDEQILIYDTRASEFPALRFSNKGSEGINSLAFSPFSQNLLAIGNSDSNINFLDLRMLSQDAQTTIPLHTMMGHGDAITSLEFSPHKDGILASGSQDRRVILWDLSKIGEEQAQEDAEDGSPEIFMMHAGHTGAVTDISWCPFMDWTLASTADDNIVHLWKVSNSLVTDESDDMRYPKLE